MSSVSRSVGRPVSRSVLAGQLNNLASIIKSLFANNEQGFAYDPNDLSTMYQDAAGTIPVTASGQPVGLVLDKSKGLSLGANIILNGDFSSGLNDWTVLNTAPATIEVITDGVAVLSAVGVGAIARLRKTMNLVVGAWHKVELLIDGNASNVTILQFGSIVGGSDLLSQNLKVGLNTIYFYAPISTVYFQLYKGINNGVAYLDNVSVKEIKGNHASQATSSMRPLLVANPQRLDFDTADDKLITNLPAQLTGCTVVRSVPNVGTQILINQTIPTPYNDNTDHCGLIVINRALTASETNQITRLFNKAAGV